LPRLTRLCANIYRIYTDGASSGNPGPSGWGAVILGAGRMIEIGGSEPHSTNNRMELMAAIVGLRRVSPDARVMLFSDSAYVINGMTTYIRAWRVNGFLRADRKPVENRDLWEALDEIAAGRVTFVKVPGHAGHRENERANDIAQSFARGNPVRLQSGSCGPPPERRRLGRRLRVRFPGYVIVDKGGLDFVRTWDECRVKVEGRRGVRYKKCASAEELDWALEKWGIDLEKISLRAKT